MAIHSKATVFATIESDGVVPVFTHVDLGVAQEVARRLVSGGLNTLEFTNRGDGAVEVFTQLVEWAPANLPDLIVGVGSVVDAPTAVLFLDLGANFVFGPTLDAGVAAVSNARRRPIHPRMRDAHRDPECQPARL